MHTPAAFSLPAPGDPSARVPPPPPSSCRRHLADQVAGLVLRVPLLLGEREARQALHEEMLHGALDLLMGGFRV